MSARRVAGGRRVAGRRRRGVGRLSERPRVVRVLNEGVPSDAEAIRNALLSTRELKVVTGTLNFDANGDGTPGITIVRNDHGRLVFIKRLDFIE